MQKVCVYISFLHVFLQSICRFMYLVSPYCPRSLRILTLIEIRMEILSFLGFRKQRLILKSVLKLTWFLIHQPEFILSNPRSSFAIKNREYL
ncbi:hypothetical protein Hanom_Chr16g01441051 [Helianthus anomalus]